MTVAEPAEPDRRGVDVRRAVAEVTGAFAGAAALVYLTGALALQLPLGRDGLPSSVAVPQLPREFLIGIGLLVAAPAVGLVLATSWAARRRSQSRRGWSATSGSGGLSSRTTRSPPRSA